MELSWEEKLAWLRLIRSENVGPVTFWGLLKRFGSAEETLDALPDLARRGGLRRSIRLYSREEAEAEFDATENYGGRILFAGENTFPASLASIDPPPPLIAAKGDFEHFQANAIAIVGSRNASAVGRRFASDLATQLGSAGFTVVSGLARGIDTSAHAGALSTGTIAVLAGGLDHIYPSENAGLYEEIASTGLIVSEQPIGLRAQARDFPKRNRLISGLSRGVVVVEAAKRSGSLITARLALEQGRDVFAVPGSPLDPRCAGTNGLIKQGARLIENADDVLAEFQMPLGSLFEQPQRSLSAFSTTPDLPEEGHNGDASEESRSRIRSLLSPSPTHIDDLVRESGDSAQDVHAALLEFDLAGLIERHVGGLVSLKSSN